MIESRKDVKKICAATEMTVAARMARRSSRRLPNPRPQRLEELVLLADEVDAERSSRQAESDRLHTEQDQQTPEDQGVHVEVAAEDRHVHEDEQRDDRPDQKHHRARQEKEKRRVID